MKKIILLLSFSLFGAIPFLIAKPLLASTVSLQTENITATINKETTDTQFEDLKSYFGKHDITIEIKNIVRNETKEITGLQLTISKGNQQSSYNMNSNLPISDLELGFKNGNVFIGNANNSISFGGDQSLSSLLNGMNHRGRNSLDSLLSKNQFSFSFGSDDIRKLLNDSNFNFDQLQEQFFSNFFNSENNASGNSSSDSNSTSQQQKSTIPKYSFFNSKSINKLIIIDGEESNFETLNKLAKANKLEEVDNLKPSTALSIYGKKAKDGAIIAITK